MGKSFLNQSISAVYKDILHTDNNNTGITGTIKQITCGDGDNTALYLSTQNVKAQPDTDSTTNTVIYDADGNALVTVDSTNDLVKLGVGQYTANTQYAYFGIGGYDSSNYSMNTHHPIPFSANTFGLYTFQDNIKFGTSTEPATTFTTADGSGTEGADLVPMLWFVPDNIAIDGVTSFEGADADATDTTRMHLYSYTYASNSTSTLTSGTLLAHNSDVTNTGSTKTFKSTWTVDSASVDANKVILAFFRSDSVNSNYSVNIIIKYHLR